MAIIISEKFIRGGRIIHKNLTVGLLATKMAWSSIKRDYETEIKIIANSIEQSRKRKIARIANKINK